MKVNELNRALLLGKIVPSNLLEEFPGVNGLAHASVTVTSLIWESDEAEVTPEMIRGKYRVSIDGTDLRYEPEFTGYCDREELFPAAKPVEKPVYPTDEWGNALDGEEDL